jgi:hypothetical protein
VVGKTSTIQEVGMNLFLKRMGKKLFRAAAPGESSPQPHGLLLFIEPSNLRCFGGCWEWPTEIGAR